MIDSFNLKNYISQEETKLAIYNQIIYSAERKYQTLLYLNDYFKKSKEYEYDIKVDENFKLVYITGDFHNIKIQEKLYDDFKNNVLWLNCNDYETVCKIHLHLLNKTYQSSLITTESKEVVFARELIYKLNILEAYELVFNNLSNALYTAVKKGNTYINVDFTISEYNITKTSNKIHFNLKNSDGVIRDNLEKYVLFLLSDELVKYGLEYDEYYGKELIEHMLEKRLKEKFPHLIISKIGNYKFEVAIMKHDDIML